MGIQFALVAKIKFIWAGNYMQGNVISEARIIRVSVSASDRRYCEPTALSKWH